MRVVSNAFWLPKAGHTAKEYEDACWPRWRYESRAVPARFAVADGATETSFSDIWARDLTQAYRKGWFATDDMARPLRGLRRLWNHRVGHMPLPWYAEEKATMGAFSSLVGLTLDDSPQQQHGSWQAMAIGDSCLFHTRAGEVLAAFPLQRSDQFDNRPSLLCSKRRSADDDLHAPLAQTGQWRSGDVFYLMTDALACWFLRHRESGGGNAHKLAEIQSQSQFIRLVRSERKNPDAGGARRLRNDDVTLLRIEVSSGGD